MPSIELNPTAIKVDDAIRVIIPDAQVDLNDLLVDNTLSVYNPEKPYGVMWDRHDNRFYRLGHNIPAVQMGMKRVVCDGNPMWGGAVIGYLDASDSTKYENGSDASADIAGANGYQVMVEIPKTYQNRYNQEILEFSWISKNHFTNSNVHPVFRKAGWIDSGDGTDVANERDFAYVTAFKGVLYDQSATSFIDGNGLSDNAGNIDLFNDKIKSVVGFKPYSGIARSEGRKLMENGGGKSYSWHIHDLLWLLFRVEYQTNNSQDAIPGYTENTDAPSYANDAQPTGLTVSLGNGSGSIEGTSPDAGFTGVIAMSYRGVENLFGHLWQWVDGINVNDHMPYLCDINGTFADDTFSGEYVRALDKNGDSVTMPDTNGYQSYQWEGTSFPKVATATSLTGITDYYYQAAGNRVVRSGGYLLNASSAGVSYVTADIDSSVANWNICVR